MLLAAAHLTKGPRAGRGHALRPVDFSATIALGTVVSVWLTVRLLRAVETIALTNALDEMEDRLSDVEKADIEGRIRERLFDEGRFGCCGH